MSDKLPLVFVHGWGLNSVVWKPLIEEISEEDCSTIDFGFVSGGQTTWHDLQKPAIYVGHSYGVLWCLLNAQINPKALISICGFDCFTSFTPKEKIDAMQDGLLKNPPAQMEQFWRRAGFSKFAPPESLQTAELSGTLSQLAAADASKIKENLSYAIKALASTGDRIVPEAATIACWKNLETVWHSTATHALPLEDPAWCAAEIRSFLQNL